MEPTLCSEVWEPGAKQHTSTTYKKFRRGGPTVLDVQPIYWSTVSDKGPRSTRARPARPAQVQKATFAWKGNGVRVGQLTHEASGG